MTIFEYLCEKTKTLESNEDYKKWLKAFLLLGMLNPKSVEYLIILDVVECAISEGNRTGDYKNYYSMKLKENVLEVI